MKEKYTTPAMEVVEFEVEDIITTSGFWKDDDETDIHLEDRKDITDLLDNASDGTETVIVKDNVNKLLYHVTIEQTAFEEAEMNE